MKHISSVLFTAFVALSAVTFIPSTQAQDQSAREKSDIEQKKKAAEWVDSLKLDNAEKATHAQTVITTHLQAIATGTMNPLHQRTRRHQSGHWQIPQRTGSSGDCRFRAAQVSSRGFDGRPAQGFEHGTGGNHPR